MGRTLTDEFHQDAVRIALTSARPKNSSNTAITVVRIRFFMRASADLATQHGLVGGRECHFLHRSGSRLFSSCIDIMAY